MITVTITRTTRESYKVTENVCTHEEPTEILGESDYGNRREVKMKRDFAPQELTKVSERRETLLSQEITDESTFNLNKVIVAINGLSKLGGM